MAPLFQMEALLPGSKISSILQSHVYPRVGRVFRALARFKSLLLDALGKSKRGVPWSSSYARKTTTKIVSHMTKPHSSSWTSGGSSARWNVTVPALAGVDDCAGEYCGYLRWLEDEAPDEVLVLEEEEEEEEDDVDAAAGGGNNGLNEIDRLAEKFIGRCHAKFLLEKQESYRRYQEMVAGSV
jgi:hypothetical protein